MWKLVGCLWILLAGLVAFIAVITHSADLPGDTGIAVASPKPVKPLTAQERANEKARREKEKLAATITRIKAIEPDVSDVTVLAGAHLVIGLAQTAVWSESNLVGTYSREALRIMQAVTTDSPNDFKKVSLELTAPVTDKFGHSSTGVLMRWSYDMGEMRKVNWDDFNDWQLLNLTKAEFTPLGRQAATAYCVEPDHQKYCGDFCAQL
jgi:hypothetical protein